MSRKTGRNDRPRVHVEELEETAAAAPAEESAAEVEGGLLPAIESRHTGGVNAAMVDGSVRFLHDPITL